ncbi:hypothetical protein [Rhodococcus sp. SGAir0479]|uniref:hypothetical protein n=1 Tax=Rhodococcus sp. SGAir0479 TaxID=2567884 RepID=UPI0010CD4406|nr:hypothetical protein [Rhodococcus sp. SGAir0479]QCQ93044.1 hypothetical protein E7742_18670 [Rhodococcus sp. SGAir0479]
MTGNQVEPATTPYRDWTGTSAAEDSKIAASGSLSELAGVDGTDSTIVAVDMWATSHGAEPDWNVSVFVVDRARGDVRKYEEMMEQGIDPGSLPVRQIDLPSVSLEDVVKCMHHIHFQLKNPSLDGMHIVEHTTYPPQD